MKSPFENIRNSLSRPGSKKESKNFPVEIIDESDPVNILSDPARPVSLNGLAGGSVYSGEGFAEKIDKQKALASFLINRINLADRGPMLDVGFGSNVHIGEEFARQGIPAVGLDVINKDKRGDLYVPPEKARTTEGGFEIYNGDIAEIAGEGSQLSDKKFGSILFNGSWISSGNNWTVAGEVMEGKYHSRQPETTDSRFMDSEKNKILNGCKERLETNGVIGVISSRYAFHGAGVDFENLPEEKLSFAELYARLKELGAKKFYFIGLSQEGFEKLVQESVKKAKEIEAARAQPKFDMNYSLSDDEIAEARLRMKDADSLPDKDVYAMYGEDKKYQLSQIKKFKSTAKGEPAFSKLARIDALFAEF